MVAPRGWPRSKPQTPRAERRCLGGVALKSNKLLRCREMSRLRGSNVTRRSARPHLFRGPENKDDDAPASQRTGVLLHASNEPARGALNAANGEHFLKCAISPSPPSSSSCSAA